MLERLHAKAAAAGLDVDGRVHLGRMQSLRLSRRYGTVIVPSSSFQLLLEPDDAAEAMRRFFALLLPGGSLAMPFIVMDKAVRASTWTKEATLEDGSIVSSAPPGHLRSRRRHRGAPTTCTRCSTTASPVRTEHFVRPRATRAYSRDQARALYETAGLRRPRVGRRLHVRGPRARRDLHDHRPPPGLGLAPIRAPARRRCLPVITFGLSGVPGFLRDGSMPARATHCLERACGRPQHALRPISLPAGHQPARATAREPRARQAARPRPPGCVRSR